MADSNSDNLSTGSSSPFHHGPVRRSSFDRFIPYRPELDVDGAHHKLLQRSWSHPSVSSSSQSSFPSANRQGFNIGMSMAESSLLASTRSLSLDDRDRPRPPLEYQRRLSLAMDLRDLPGTSSSRILPLSSAASPRSPSISTLSSSRCSDHGAGAEGGSSSQGSTPPHTPRKFRAAPDTVVLVAIRDDLYCNLMDWGRCNNIALGAKGGAYIWNAGTSRCQYIQPYLPRTSLGSHNPIPAIITTTPTPAIPAILSTTPIPAVPATLLTTVTERDEARGGRRGDVGRGRGGGGGRGRGQGGRERGSVPLVVVGGRQGSREDDWHRPRGHVSSVRWDKAGGRLALGYSHGALTIWDAHGMDLSQDISMPEGAQLDSLCWWNNTIFCGTSSGRVYHLDLRQKSLMPALCPPVHRKHVCNIQLAPDEASLACGGADGIINIWEPRGKSVTTKLHAHKSGAKALAWCPWRRSVLASGGGSHDGLIRIWSINAGMVKTEVDTGMQVCHVLWSEEYRELVSGHSGEGRHELVVWSVRDLNLTLLGHLHSPRGRPLVQCLSPDCTTLASASADDHLSLWKLFPKKRRSVLSTSPLNLDRFVR